MNISNDGVLLLDISCTERLDELDSISSVNVNLSHVRYIESSCLGPDLVVLGEDTCLELDWHVKSGKIYDFAL